jgi:hypothetical protein
MCYLTWSPTKHQVRRANLQCYEAGACSCDSFLVSGVFCPCKLQYKASLSVTAMFWDSVGGRVENPLDISTEVKAKPVRYMLV